MWSKTTKIIFSIVAFAAVVIVAGVIYVAITDHADRTTADAVAPTPVPTGEPTATNDPTGLGKVDTHVALGRISTSENKKVENLLETALKPEMEVYEEDVINLMHHMTHQKVKASDKWTSIQMTSNRVRLIGELIEQKGQTWKNRDQLLKITKKWEAGDFSKIDDDHNYLWSLEDGSIGKATGILSAEEEQAFIVKTFN
ncbi:DUF6241 domain-containing protein [Paenibacillus sp. HJGM_3]|uniref:DUF6241 domain-containing protein n=1 Tax=Paenibacillus sp. HJGM_3 TaxID=3379816 RepID=UPI003859F0E4